MLYFCRVCKDLKAKQAKQSMDSSKSVNSDKTIKNKQERDRCEKKYITLDAYWYTWYKLDTRMSTENSVSVLSIQLGQ